MKILTHTHQNTRMITAYLFFALTLLTVLRLLILNFPALPIVHNSSPAYVAGCYAG